MWQRDKSARRADIKFNGIRLRCERCKVREQQEWSVERKWIE